jgi:hypothetical protein
VAEIGSDEQDFVGFERRDDFRNQVAGAWLSFLTGKFGHVFCVFAKEVIWFDGLSFGIQQLGEPSAQIVGNRFGVGLIGLLLVDADKPGFARVVVQQSLLISELAEVMVVACYVGASDAVGRVEQPEVDRH